MVDHARAARLAKRITTIVASAIGTEIKDPRLAHVTITDCRVTGDLHDATVFYTVMGESVDAEPDVEAAAAGLAKATGALRSLVGAGTGVRFTPTLRFELDTVPDATRAMDELLARARAQDEMVARAAREATPAGDADPYRHDEDEDEAGQNPTGARG
ncbi:30S ribosome-binding factor RbfA [Gordonia iterans]|uniref:Ribosome-binding factor A n=1 Tax=Gordonia iterans TaxID=1004901 RepID=A0A2S0KFH9_9ACTN|nr:30S ribosome-binding factor RbfA [Gordonia iterans]AVM00435.1 30S ribosome-binding factor RbfA [Gordonia iterans]